MDRKQSQSQMNLNFSHSIQQNLSIIHEELKESLKKFTKSELQQSSSSQFCEDIQLSQQQKRIHQGIQQLRRLFLSWGKNDIQSILIYNKLTSQSVQVNTLAHFAFQNTLFHQNLWPLLTHFLEIKLNYSTLIKSNSRAIDVWYQYISCEEKVIFEKALSKNIFENQNLGDWFRKQCLQSLFANFFAKSKKSYTNFIADLFLHGLSVLFLKSVSILNFLVNQQKISKYSKQSEKQIKLKLIQINYIDKYHLYQMNDFHLRSKRKIFQA